MLDIVSGDGKVWFYTDRVMFELANGNQTLAIRAADIRIGPALANRLGVPEANGWEVGDMAMNTQVNITGQQQRARSRLHAVSVAQRAPCRMFRGAIYQGDLFMQTFLGRSGRLHALERQQWMRRSRRRRRHRRLRADILADQQQERRHLRADRSERSARHEHVALHRQHRLVHDVHRQSAELQPAVQERSASVPDLEPLSHQCRRHHRADRSLGREACVPDDQRRLPRFLQRSAIRSASAAAIRTVRATTTTPAPWVRARKSSRPRAPGAAAARSGIRSAPARSTATATTRWTQRMQVHESQLDPAVESRRDLQVRVVVHRARRHQHLELDGDIERHAAFPGGTWSLNGQSDYRLGPAIDRWVDPAQPPANSLELEHREQRGSCQSRGQGDRQRQRHVDLLLRGR